MILIHWAKWRFRRSWFWLSFSWGNGWLNDDQFLSWHDRLHGKKIGPLWFIRGFLETGDPLMPVSICFTYVSLVCPLTNGWFPTGRAPLIHHRGPTSMKVRNSVPQSIAATVRKNGGHSGRQNGLVVYLPKFGISSQHSGVPTRITQAFNVWVYQMSDFKARMLATGCRSIRWLLKHQ